MAESIITAIITGAVTLIVCLLNNRQQEKRTAAQHEKTVALIEYRLIQLEKKVDLHNNAVERLYEAEKNIELQEEKIKVANHRIDDLEKAK